MNRMTIDHRSGRHALPRHIWVLCVLYLVACRETPPGHLATTAETGDTLSPVTALRDGADEAALEGYAKADEARDFVFPADHGPHPDFRTEWWYWVGQLHSDDGRRFGFQLTFFQQALAPAEDVDTRRSSAWATRHLMMAHFALADIDGASFRSAERFSRMAAGLAGAELAVDDERPRLRVWLEDWSVESSPGAPAEVVKSGDGLSPLEGGAVFPLRLRARGDGAALDLRLETAKPPVLQGDGGLSRKGTRPGSASYYYSMTHLPAKGMLQLDDQSFRVEGRAWLDREWSTSQLEDDQVGWDWLALWLDDGRELMVFNLRLEDGGLAPSRHGSLVGVDGGKRYLDAASYTLEPVGEWTSPRSGITYPARWRLSIPSEALELDIEPLLADQELAVSFRYWEGAVAVRGTGPEGDVAGDGYLEMVGYGSEP